MTPTERAPRDEEGRAGRWMAANVWRCDPHTCGGCHPVERLTCLSCGSQRPRLPETPAPTVEVIAGADDAMLDRITLRDGSLRMGAYYYHFGLTGVEVVDRVLAAVASAGKGYHHTESWADDDNGPSYRSVIQHFADQCAAALRAAPVEGGEPVATAMKRGKSISIAWDDERLSAWAATLADGHHPLYAHPAPDAP